MKINTTNLIRILLLLFFISFSFLFYYYSPEKIINFIGVENAYILMFILALVGGMTTFSGVPYHVILIMLASGGLNPFYIGLSSSFGVMLGDTTSYYVGYSGGHIVPKKIQNNLQKFCSYCLSHPRILPIAFLLYGSLVPLSNDFIVISMGLARFPFWRVMIPLGIGNLIFNISLAYLSVYAYQFTINLF
jgi:membrane protein YqaA with SNARE-associated domain